MQPITLILHNIRSTHNVGSLFRTADAAGVEKVLLTGYTPSPIDRFGRERGDIAKASLGAEKTVAWQQCDTVSVAIMALRETGHTIIALEQSPRSIAYTDYTPIQPLALIVGNEVDGLSRDILERCDTVLEIPMHGEKESLNVSVAGGIVLFRLCEAMAQS